MAKKPAPDESEDAAASDSSAGGESGAASESGDNASGGSGSQSEAPAGSESGDASEEAPKKSGPQKKGSGRVAAKSGKTGRATGSQRAVGPAKDYKPVGSGADLVPVICSECYEEFVFDSKVRSESLTCPICEHQAARPDDAQLAVIAEKRKQEKTNFTISFALCFLAMASFSFWIMAMRNPHTNAHDNGALYYGPVFLSGLLFAGCLGFALAKYEGARHDVYF